MRYWFFFFSVFTIRLAYFSTHYIQHCASGTVAAMHRQSNAVITSLNLIHISAKIPSFSDLVLITVYVNSSQSCFLIMMHYFHESFSSVAYHLIQRNTSLIAATPLRRRNLWGLKKPLRQIYRLRRLLALLTIHRKDSVLWNIWNMSVKNFELFHSKMRHRSRAKYIVFILQKAPLFLLVFL